MADQTVSDSVAASLESGAGKLFEALAEVLKSSTSPEARQAQALILRRLALEGSVVPSRVPAPRNITEIGGYINLLTELKMDSTREHLLSAILGLPGPDLKLDEIPIRDLVLYDVTRVNDRPEGAAQPTIPVEFHVRNDFAAALDGAVSSIRKAGCAMPILSTTVVLPIVGSKVSDLNFLATLGRTLDLVPATALRDPDLDPLAFAKVDGGTVFEVVARQLDATAPDAASVPDLKWSAYKCDSTKCDPVDGNRKYLRLEPILARAGFYLVARSGPKTLNDPGGWARFRNITGLVAGVTRFGDELSARFPAGHIASSSAREALSWVWNGATFEPPA